MVSRNEDSGEADISGNGIEYEDVMKAGIRSCLRTARELHDPSTDWAAFSQRAAEEVVELFSREERDVPGAARHWADSASALDRRAVEE